MSAFKDPSTVIAMIRVFILGSRCNMKCRFCMSVEKELDREVVMAKLGEMRAGDMVVFSGGEPLLYRELRDYLEFSKKIGLKTKIHTNGTLLSSCEFLDLIDVVNLPVDGPERVHDSMRGRGHFRTVMNAFNLRKEFTVTTVVTKLNAGWIGETAEIINTLGNVLNWKVFRFKPKGRGEMYRREFEISWREFEAAVRAAREIADVRVMAIADPDRMKTETVRSL